MTDRDDAATSSGDSDNPRARELLGTPRVVAVVGMSPKPDRASNYVARYLRDRGFNTIPVNPTVAEVDGLQAYPDLSAIPKNAAVEIAALFVAPERTLPAVEQAAAAGVRVVWFQPGVEYPPAIERASALGLEVFTGLCMKGEHARLFGGEGC